MTRNTSCLGSSTIPDGTWDYKEHLKTEMWQVPQLFINTFPHPGKLPQQRLLPLSLALSMTLNPLYMDSTIQTCSWTALYIPMVHKTFNLVLYRCFLVPASLTLSWTPTTMYICIHTCTHTHAHPCKYSYKARPFSLCSQGLAQASSLTPDLDACIPLLCFALGGISWPLCSDLCLLPPAFPLHQWMSSLSADPPQPLLTQTLNTYILLHFTWGPLHSLDSAWKTALHYCVDFQLKCPLL